MQLDIILNEFATPHQAGELAQLAERWGFRGLWSANYGSQRDPFMTLIKAAERTASIRLGPLAVSPMELHPLKMATQLLTLNEWCGGRAMIAVGGGGGALQALDIKRERMIRSVRECLEILRGATSGEPLTYKGEIYRTRHYRPHWAEDAPPQIYVAANHPQTTRLAARLADGLMGSDLVPSMIEQSRGWMEEGFAEYGARPGFRFSNFWAWHIKDDKAASEREARRELILRGMMYPRYTDAVLSAEESALVQKNRGSLMRAWMTGSGRIEGIPDEIIHKLLDEMTAWGDMNGLDHALEKMLTFKELGLTEVAIRVHDDPADAVKIIGEHILPKVR